MQINSIKFILLTVFTIFLVHDIIPHIHIDEHSDEYESKEMSHESNDHGLILDHHIDDNFISKKPSNLFFKLSVVTFLNPNIFTNHQNIDLHTKEFQVYKKEQIPLPPILGSLCNKAPPII